MAVALVFSEESSARARLMSSRLLHNMAMVVFFKLVGSGPFRANYWVSIQFSVYFGFRYLRNPIIKPTTRATRAGKLDTI